MNNDALQSEIEDIFNPEVDEEMAHREFPHERLTKFHKLNFDYLMKPDWVGSTMHPDTRLCPAGDTGVAMLIKNQDVPSRLQWTALRLYADSIVSYVGHKDQNTSLRYYPPVILTFWSAFESLVRHSSEMMLFTSGNIPPAIADYLRESSPKVDRKGNIASKTQFTPVLDRYSVLLRYGFGIDVDRGNAYWQKLVLAKELRDYYTHVDVTRSRSITDREVLDFLEAVLLGLIWPSSLAQKSVMVGAFDAYNVWASLRDLTEEHLPNGHAEEPLFHSWTWEKEPFQFYCPFVSVDKARFPNTDDERQARENKKQS